MSWESLVSCTYLEGSLRTLYKVYFQDLNSIPKVSSRGLAKVGASLLSRIDMFQDLQEQVLVFEKLASCYGEWVSAF